MAAGYCLDEDPTTGALVVNGTLYDPVANPCQFVVLTGEEAEQLSAGLLPPLTPEQAFAIAGAIGGVWAIAWIIRQCVQTLKIA